MPHGVEPIVGHEYVNEHGRRFTVLSVDRTNVVIRFRGEARIIMSKASWQDLRLQVSKAAQEARKKSRE